jgi:polysaccharide export outer membrane protein
MTSVNRLFAVICALLACVGATCAATPAGTSPQAAPAPLLQIGPGDQLRIEVFNNAELNTLTNVADDGSIRMPLAGAVPVSGGSTAEAELKIEAALKAGEYLVDPHVTVTVVTSLSQRVSVIGEVGNAGRYPIESNSTVLDAIALAGGITEMGSDSVYILRADAAGVLQRLPIDLRGLMTLSTAGSAPVQTLRGGDTVVVPKGTFFITGEVRQPNEYRLEGGMVLLQAIAKAGGVTERGSASRVEIKRRRPDGEFVDVKARKDTRIEPGDVIRVKERLF